MRSGVAAAGVIMMIIGGAWLAAMKEGGILIIEVGGFVLPYQVIGGGIAFLGFLTFLAGLTASPPQKADPPIKINKHESEFAVVVGSPLINKTIEETEKEFGVKIEEAVRVDGVNILDLKNPIPLLEPDTILRVVGTYEQIKKSRLFSIDFKTRKLSWSEKEILARDSRLTQNEKALMAREFRLPRPGGEVPRAQRRPETNLADKGRLENGGIDQLGRERWPRKRSLVAIRRAQEKSLGK